LFELAGRLDIGYVHWLAKVLYDVASCFHFIGLDYYFPDLARLDLESYGFHISHVDEVCSEVICFFELIKSLLIQHKRINQPSDILPKINKNTFKHLPWVYVH
jgi:hypothetical protein